MNFPLFLLFFSLVTTYSLEGKVCCTLENSYIQSFTSVTTPGGTMLFQGPQAIAFNPLNSCVALADWNLNSSGHVYLASVNSNGTVNNGSALEINPPAPYINFSKPVGLSFTSDGNWLIIADAQLGPNGSVIVYQYKGCGVQPTYHSTLPVPIGITNEQSFGVNVSLDGKNLVVVYNGGSSSPGAVVLYSITSSINNISFTQTDQITGIGMGSLESGAFSPDNKYVAIGLTLPVSEVQFFPISNNVFTSKTPIYIYPAGVNTFTFESVSFAPALNAPNLGCFAYALTQTMITPSILLNYDGSGPTPLLTNPQSTTAIFVAPEQENFSPDGQILGAPDEAQKTFFIFIRSFVVQAFASSPTCAKQTILLTSTIIPGGTSIPPYSYTWTDPNNVVIGNNSSIIIPSSIPGQYMLSVEDSSGCVASTFYIVPIIITVTPSAVINVGGTTTTLTTNASGGTPPYTLIWSGPGVPADNTVNPIMVNIPKSPGNYIYSVTVTDSNGCTTTADIILQSMGTASCISMMIQNKYCAI